MQHDASETALLVEFLTQARCELDKLKLEEGPLSIVKVRQVLLQTQLSCLQLSVDKINNNSSNDDANISLDRAKILVSQAQNDSSTKALADLMNDSARQAFARLVLQSEIMQENSSSRARNLKDSGSMSRGDILEFCGLCNASVKIPNVVSHLANGGPILAEPDTSIDDNEVSTVTTSFPQKRLENIQGMLLRSLGYDPAFGKAEIKRIFYTHNDNELSNNTELVSVYTKMVANLNKVIDEATQKGENTVFSDVDQGGHTRVVNVSHSEIDAETGEVLSKDVPSTQSMRSYDATGNSVALAAAARLEQEILGELLSMDETERNELLKRAKEASDNLILRISSCAPDSPERMAILTEGMDYETQRLLAMHKIWTKLVASNGGQPPNIQYNY